jgi:hypothetical protein
MAEASAAGQPASYGGQAQPRVPSDQEKALSKDLQKRIEDRLRDCEKDFHKFAENRQMLRGILPGGKKLRTNLHYANLAAMRPQVYAKDPEFTVQPTPGVPSAQLAVMRKFGETGEALLEHYLIHEARLKQRAKRILTSAYTNAVGWWKLAWQQGRPADPLISSRLKDTQDNLAALKRQRAEMKDPAAGSDHDLKIAQYEQTLAGLQTEAEKRIGRGLALDFVMPDDMLVLDRSVFEVQDYLRAQVLAQRVWMTRDQYVAEFGYDPQRAKVFRTKDDKQAALSGPGSEAEKGGQLLCVFECWDQGQNRVHTVCLGEEGLSRGSYSPDWTGRRWLPFFLLLWNEVDGAFLPPSDVELTDAVVRGYNDTREDFTQDRRDARPFTLFRKGGSLTPTDVENIRNRKGNDLIGVEGVTGKPVSDDIMAIQLGTLNPAVYDTAGDRADMEMLVGGGDAARGAVLKAKTATEAEILAQGMRGRSAERTDVIEDLLSEVGGYALEVMLRKLTPEEVRQVAGEDAVWPELSAEQVFGMVRVRVRGGSTGKPDRLQEQDRWTKLMPVIKDTVKEIVAVRQAGQEQLAQLAIALLKETLRRFDEAFEVDQYIPEPEGDGPAQDGAPQLPPELIEQVQQQMAELQKRAEVAEQKLLDRQADIEGAVRKAQADAWAKVESAKAVAPIEAQAEVEVARVKSEAQKEAQMHAQTLNAAGQAEATEQERAQGEAANAELQAIASELAALKQFQERMDAFVQQVSAPRAKVKRKVVHVPGADGQIAESVLVEEEEQGA